MRIAVFCSQYEVAEKYKKVAEEITQLIAAHKHSLVFGGIAEGLMGIVARGAHAGGSRVIGVTREQIRDRVYANANEIHIVENAYEMNLGIIERADAIIVLAGGIGTLNELTEMIRMIKNGVHQKPVVIMNTDNFYEGLRVQLNKMHEEGFLRDDVMQSVQFVSTPRKGMDLIETTAR